RTHIVVASGTYRYPCIPLQPGDVARGRERTTDVQLIAINGHRGHVVIQRSAYAYPLAAVPFCNAAGRLSVRHGEATTDIERVLKDAMRKDIVIYAGAHLMPSAAIPKRCMVHQGIACHGEVAAHEKVVSE